MNTRIYDKTDKGREEIATRKYQVPSKLQDAAGDDRRAPYARVAAEEFRRARA